MAGEISGKQLRAGSVANTRMAAGFLSADSTGRALVAANFFDEATVDAKFASGAIDTDRLKEGTAFVKSDGTVPMAAALAMGTNKITGLADGSNATDAATKGQLDNALTGIKWKDPVDAANLLGNVQVEGLVGNLNAAAIEVLAVVGDAYVVTVADGVAALAAAAVGDIWQYVGAAWTKIVSGAGGFVPNNTYALLSTTTPGGLIAPYTDVTHDGYRCGFDGTNNDPQVSGTFVAPVPGVAYVIDGPGASLVGALIEWNGASWAVLTAGPGGFPAAGTRAIVGLTVGETLIGPYTDGVDDGKIVEFDNTSSTGADTGEALDGNAVLVQDSTHSGYYDNLGFVYEGVVPTGSWTQFTGAGTINAGAGMDKTGNTMFIAEENKGVRVLTNGLRLDAAEVAGDGLKATAGGGNEHVLAIEPADFAGNGLEDDGSDNLQIKPDSALTDDAAAVKVGANGLSIDGDIVSIDQVPTTYTRNTGGTGVDLKDLASHLYGIDQYLGTIATGALTKQDKKLTPAACAVDDADTGLDITSTPDGWVGVMVNNIGPYELGDGVTTKDCYFSSNGLPGGVRAIAAIAAGDSLVWNAVIAGFSLDGVNDRIDLVYEV